MDLQRTSTSISWFRKPNEAGRKLTDDAWVLVLHSAISFLHVQGPLRAFNGHCQGLRWLQPEVA